MDDLREKVCLVTGASTGIGAAVARALGGHGASVAVHYHRSADQAERVVKDIHAGGGRAVLLQGDVGDPAVAGRLVADTVAAVGRLDVLINNAGGPLRRCEFVDTSDALYDELMNLNFRSVFATCRAAGPRFRRQGSGTIINTTSVAARHGGGPGALIYAAAKAAVSSLTRGLARELAPHRIRVNAISPGVVLTPIHERLSTPGHHGGVRPQRPDGAGGGGRGVRRSVPVPGVRAPFELHHRTGPGGQRWAVHAVAARQGGNP